MIHHTATAEARRRLRRRHRAEARLRILGGLAIAIAAAALASLLWSVVSRAHLAATETYLLIDPDVSAAAGAPSEWTADEWHLALRNGLGAMVPDAAGRRLRRELGALLSDGAPWDLAGSGSAGSRASPRPVRALASDHVDLYFKGRLAKVERREGGFPARLAPESGGYVLLAPEGASFAEAYVSLRESLRRLADGRREEARRLREGAAVLREDQVGSSGASDLAAERERRLAKARELDARADDLANRSLADAVTAGPELPSVLVSAAGGFLRATELGERRLLLEALVEPRGDGELAAGSWRLLTTEQPPAWRSLSDHQIAWLEMLAEEGRTVRKFNWRLLTSSNSREPELAGLRDAAAGSFWTLLVCFLVTAPVGVLAALYLEEFAPRNRITDVIEININNLAAVPSIVFGLLGLAAFIQFFGIPRSVPLAGGLVLALMTLPTVIIAARAAIRAVPQSIRDAALGIGASPMQTTMHHVLPLAMPGILTGVIIGMAQALGETAPLLLIGMVAFIVGGESGILEPASVLPVQIFQWADFPEQAFANRAAAAILVLVLFLVAMNLLAVLLRRRFERRW